MVIYCLSFVTHKELLYVTNTCQYELERPIHSQHKNTLKYNLYQSGGESHLKGCYAVCL